MQLCYVIAPFRNLSRIEQPDLSLCWLKIAYVQCHAYVRWYGSGQGTCSRTDSTLSTLRLTHPMLRMSIYGIYVLRMYTNSQGLQIFRYRRYRLNELFRTIK